MSTNLAIIENFISFFFSICRIHRLKRHNWAHLDECWMQYDFVSQNVADRKSRTGCWTNIRVVRDRRVHHRKKCRRPHRQPIFYVVVYQLIRPFHHITEWVELCNNIFQYQISPSSLCACNENCVHIVIVIDANRRSDRLNSKANSMVCVCRCAVRMKRLYKIHRSAQNAKINCPYRSYRGGHSRKLIHMS